MGLWPDADPASALTLRGLLPPKPITLTERAALFVVQRAQIHLAGGAFVEVDAHGMRTHFPIGGVACQMPGDFAGLRLVSFAAVRADGGS